MKLKKSRYLTFVLDNENYGIAINSVKEIIGGMMNFTNLPKSTEFLKGVINLRGKIIPLLDLRLKFDMSEKKYTERTCIIVIEIVLNNKNKLIGVVVDSVSEVIEISNEEIEESNTFEINESSEFVSGIGKVKDKVIIILNIENVISYKELVQLENLIA